MRHRGRGEVGAAWVCCRSGLRNQGGRRTAPAGLCCLDAAGSRLDLAVRVRSQGGSRPGLRLGSARGGAGPWLYTARRWGQRLELLVLPLSPALAADVAGGARGRSAGLLPLLLWRGARLLVLVGVYAMERGPGEGGVRQQERGCSAWDW